MIDSFFKSSISLCFTKNPFIPSLIISFGPLGQSNATTGVFSAIDSIKTLGYIPHKEM